MAHRLPKIAPTVIERVRVQTWLEFHAATAVRFVCAPAGSGKTTAAVLYARSRAGRVAFVTPAYGCSEASLVVAIADASGCGPVDSYRMLIERLAVSVPIEIVIDDCDDLSPAASAMLGHIYRDVPDGVTFIYLARAMTAVAFPQARAHGLVDVCDSALFAFDAPEIARYAASLGRREDSAHIVRLHEATHGWAIAVAGVCRTAASSGLPVPEALRYWFRLNAAALGELVADALARADADVRALFEDIANGRAAPNAERLAVLHRAGLFVMEWNGRHAINPLLRRDACSIPDPLGGAPPPVAQIEMFGRFTMTVNGRAVSWIRRRDRQIVQYLAMQPQGRAMRSEIIAAFWPQADRQLAGQSLRSACSTIRRAIGECVGRANVERYFGGDHALQVNLDNVVITTRQFSQHVELAEAAYARRDNAEAFTLYRAAELLYRAPFLGGEPPMPWAQPHEVYFAAAIGRVAARLDELSEHLQTADAARGSLRTAWDQVSA